MWDNIPSDFEEGSKVSVDEAREPPTALILSRSLRED